VERIVIVGASLAGLRAAEQLRHEGFAGTLTLLGAEAHEPYDRPPLSKQVLAGDWEVDRVVLRQPDELAKLDVELRVGARAVALDAANRTVILSDAEAVKADGIVVATGAEPRTLPGQPDLPGIHVLRTLDDSLRLRDDLQPDRRVVVVGAGFIGLEVAATARKRGCEVVVLEGLEAPLMRGLGAEMGRIVGAVHGRHGVDVRCGVQVEGIEGDDRVGGVRLGDGELIPADVVVVGIGVSPTTGWLEGSGLEVRDGVVCDPTLRAGFDGVYAAGDIARWFNELYGEEMRIEHWTNAAEQGALAGANMLAVSRGDEPKAYSPVPYFWSDQFDSKVQFLGRAHADDTVHVFAGDTADKFAALYGHDGRVCGILGVGMPRAVMPRRKLLLERATWEEALAAVAG
jgi:NADPH-dependent 2,4-dienoyl-CoA reductase/sulfur reductase-like enzyme